MMPSRSLPGCPATDNSRILSGQYQDETDVTDRDARDNYFVAEDDGFLDAVAAALDQLTTDCKTALRWSHDDADTDAAIQAAEQSFCTIISICKEAGLIVSGDNGDGYYDINAWDHSHSTSDTFAPSCSSVNPMREVTSSWTNKSVDNAACEQETFCEDIVRPLPTPVPRESLREAQLEAVAMAPTEEIVEVELTDLLTQSHEEMLSLQRVFEARMDAAEQTREEYEHKHAEEMHSLQEELASSCIAMDRIKQELLDSNSRKLEGMHSAITASQRAIEAGMKDQARYWKSICEELVAEKRDMAQKVAEERGRYTALKAHLASHDDASSRPTSHSRVRIRSACDEENASNMSLCELSRSVAPPLQREFASGNQGSNEVAVVGVSPCNTPTDPSSSLATVPNSESVGEPSSAEVSPTHSNSSSNSSKTGKSTFRRYYLAQNRENRVVLHQSTCRPHSSHSN